MLAACGLISLTSCQTGWQNITTSSKGHTAAVNKSGINFNSVEQNQATNPTVNTIENRNMKWHEKYIQDQCGHGRAKLCLPEHQEPQKKPK